jgi:NADP-dependent 3-hydroxy acid dehydrogenase YdfG
MKATSMKKVLITGASSGIGKAVALSLDSSDYELFLVARREEALMEVKNQLRHARAHLIVGDVTQDEFYTHLKKNIHGHIDILINNAGLALGREKIESARFADSHQMIQTNITAAFRMVHEILPDMISHGGGDIVNLCSIAGHYSYTGGAVYCATKHAVKAFTSALREETCGQNIRVMQISPGMVETEFSKVRFKGDELKAKNVYEGMTPLSATDIAEMIKFMLERPRHVVIDEIITMPLDQGAPMTVHRKDAI